MAWLRCQPCDDNPQSRAALWPALLRLLGFIPPVFPCVSSAFFSQGCELDLEACPLRCDGFEQRMEVAASGLTLGGASIQVAKTAKEYVHDYRDAGKQILHAQHQGQQLRLNLKQLKELPPSKQERIAPAKAAFDDIQGALPTVIQPTRKRDRLQWIAGGKSKFEREIFQNGRMETSATLNLLLSLSQDM